MATVSGGGFVGPSAAEAVQAGARQALAQKQFEQDKKAQEYAALKASVDAEVASQYQGDYARWLNASPNNIIKQQQLASFQMGGNPIAAALSASMDAGSFGNTPMQQTVEQAKAQAYWDYANGLIAPVENTKQPSGTTRTRPQPTPAPVTPTDTGAKVSLDLQAPLENAGISTVPSEAAASVNKALATLTSQSGKQLNNSDMNILIANAAKEIADPTAKSTFVKTAMKAFTQDPVTGNWVAPSPQSINQTDYLGGQSTLSAASQMSSELGPITGVSPLLKKVENYFVDKDGKVDPALQVKFFRDTGKFEPKPQPAGSTLTQEQWEADPMNWVAKQGEKKFEGDIITDANGRYAGLKVDKASKDTPTLQSKVTETLLPPAQKAVEESKKDPTNVGKKAIAAKKVTNFYSSSWAATEKGKKSYSPNKYLKPSNVADVMNNLDNIDQNTDWRKSGFIASNGQPMELVLAADRIAVEKMKNDTDLKKLAEDARQADQSNATSNRWASIEEQRLANTQNGGSLVLGNNMQKQSEEANKLLDDQWKIYSQGVKNLMSTTKTTWQETLKPVAGKSAKEIEAYMQKTLGYPTYDKYYASQFAKNKYDIQEAEIKKSLAALMANQGLSKEQIDKAVKETMDAAFAVGSPGSTTTGTPGTNPLDMGGYSYQNPPPASTTTTPTDKKPIPEGKTLR
jgi:hypothetical protein